VNESSLTDELRCPHCGSVLGAELTLTDASGDASEARRNEWRDTVDAAMRHEIEENQ
jgi:hypothetical protein